MQAERTKRHPAVERECVLCGAHFMAAYNRVVKGGARYCSYPCAYAGHRLSVAPLSERFWALVDTSGECWLWRGWQDKDGYGLFYRALRDGGKKARIVRATRVAWELATRETPSSDQPILHTCDTPACVRNDNAGWYEVDGLLLPRRGHLVLGTHKANMRDMMRKGRALWCGSDTHGKAARGERNAHAKLTVEQVREIRRLAKAGETHDALAVLFDTRQSNISRIVKHEAWKHVLDS